MGGKTGLLLSFRGSLYEFQMGMEWIPVLTNGSL